jgi:tetratricopeptide (TPR) repeat protein
MLARSALLLAAVTVWGQGRVDEARQLAAKGRVAEALAVLDQAVAGSDDPELRFQAGKLLRQLAELRFANLQRIAPDSAPVHELAGRRHELEGRFSLALEEYRAAQARDPSRPGLHYKAGNVLWALRESQAAESELRAELERNPGHGMANLRLGQILAARNADSAAVTPLERAVEVMPESAEARRDLGKAYRKIGRNTDARHQWELLAKSWPADGQVHFLLANLYRALGETELANKEFETHRAILERRRVAATR